MNFKFLKIPVKIEPTFWIILLFFAGIIYNPSWERLIVAGVMFVSLLVHEYGHAFAAAYFGNAPVITLHGLGGYTSFQDFNISKKQRFIITLCGPLLESVLIAISYYLLKTGTFTSYYIQYTLYVTMELNIIWCLLNLIPIEPLDGSRLLRGILEGLFGRKGEKISIIMGLISVVFFVPYLFFIGHPYFSVLLLFFGIRNYLNFKKQKVERSPFNLYMSGIKALDAEDLVEAKDHFKKLLKSNDIQLKHAAIESLAKIYCQENKSQKAYELLLKGDPQYLQEGKILLCKLAFERKNHELIGKYSHEIYTHSPSYEIAVLNSQAFACMNHPELAGGWLTTASQFGHEYHEKVKELLKHTLYDSVRSHESFQKYSNLFEV